MSFRPSALASTAFAALVASGMAVGSSAALAQTQAPPPPAQNAPAQTMPGQQGAPQASFTEEELKSYAEATVEVQEIGAKWQPQMVEAQEAKDAEKVAAVQRDAEAEMVEAVKDKGLSVEQYNEITRVAQVDQNLRNKITGHMQR